MLPAELRAQDRIEPGQQFDVERVEAGQYLLKKVPPQSGDMLAWLLACPEKDWFEPLPPGEDATKMGEGLFDDEHP